MQDQGQPPLYTDAIVSIEINDADDQNPLFAQSRYWAHLPQPARKVVAETFVPRKLFGQCGSTSENLSNEKENSF